MTDVLSGEITSEREQVLEVLQLPDDRLEELLALAHEVRMRWCGPEVEVEGIISLKTGGCPEDCHFCSQSGLFASPVRSASTTRHSAGVSCCFMPRYLAGAANSGASSARVAAGRYHVAAILTPCLV